MHSRCASISLIPSILTLRSHIDFNFPYGGSAQFNLSLILERGGGRLGCVAPQTNRGTPPQLDQRLSTTTRPQPRGKIGYLALIHGHVVIVSPYSSLFEGGGPEVVKADLIRDGSSFTREIIYVDELQGSAL